MIKLLIANNFALLKALEINTSRFKVPNAFTNHLFNVPDNFICAYHIGTFIFSFQKPVIVKTQP